MEIAISKKEDQHKKYILKLKRTIASILPVNETRSGSCRNCGACCKLTKKCRFLTFCTSGQARCRIYKFRPPNCRKYPRSSKEFVTAESCGYRFREAPADENEY